MNSGPILQLPEQEKKSPPSAFSGAMVMLQLLILVAVVLSVFIPRYVGPDKFVDPAATADRLKQVAVKLESNNLHESAAQTWEEYLELAELDRYQTGNIRFRVGKLWQASGNYARALSQFYLAEALLADSSADLTRDINVRVAECLRRMGRYAELAREVAARSADNPQAAVAAGDQVVAQIGPDKLTVADFDRLLSHEIDLAVRSRMGHSSEEEDALRRRFHEQFADPAARARQLEQIVATRVLAEEARANALHEDKAFRDRLVAVADNLLASTQLFEEIKKRATVTDEDVKRFHAANRDRYDEPAASYIAHILCASQDDAKGLLERINEGESFDQLAKSHSLDAATKDKFGILSTPLSKEANGPSPIALQNAVRERILAAATGSVLDEPVKSDRGWHVIKVVSHRERTERPFDQIADVVRRDTQAAREREVTEMYLAELFDKMKVKLYPEAFTMSQPDQVSDEEP